MTETIIATTPQKNFMSLKTKNTPGQPIFTELPPNEFFSLSKLNMANYTFAEVPLDALQNSEITVLGTVLESLLVVFLMYHFLCCGQTVADIIIGFS